jgi:uncharacterized protein
MINKAGMRGLKWLAAGAFVLIVQLPVLAQEPTAEHLAAAREAITALHATEQFDAILPNAAQGLKVSLIQTAPNLQDIISATVDETALSMVGRRTDLEREAAKIYANNFSIEELQAISAFYNSPAGTKLLEAGPEATRELLRAAEIWSNGVSRDLTVQVDEALKASVGEAPIIGDNVGNGDTTGSSTGDN